MKTRKHGKFLRSALIFIPAVLCAVLFSCGKADLPDATSAVLASETSVFETSFSRAAETSRIFSGSVTTEYISTESRSETALTTTNATTSATTNATSATTTTTSATTSATTTATSATSATTKSSAGLFRSDPVKTVSKNVYAQVVPFETEYIYSDELYEGDRRMLRAGVCGVNEITEYIYYTDGAETGSTREIKSKSPAVAEQIMIGTKPIFDYQQITVRENTVIASTVYVSDATIYEGERKTTSVGEDGYEINTYKITYKYGSEISRELIGSEKVDAKNTVIGVGTKKKEEAFRMPFKTSSEGGEDYAVTQYFGQDGHGGIDFGVYYGSPILAAKSGTVLYAYNDGYFSSSDLRWTYGTYVVIDHGDGYLSYYAHLSSKAVSAGDKVTQGEVIGYSGNTGRVSPAPTSGNRYAGTHLHFEIRKYSSGSYVRVDPRDYLPRWNK